MHNSPDKTDLLRMNHSSSEGLRLPHGGQKETPRHLHMERKAPGSAVRTGSVTF